MVTRVTRQPSSTLRAESEYDSSTVGANFVNRTLWTGDNLDILRGLNSESVDLIYLDPPFTSNRDYAAPGHSPISTPLGPAT